MAQKQSENKKDKHPENIIREGSGDHSIHQEKKSTDLRSYPRPSYKDEQLKNQPEFLDGEPNRKDEGE